MSGCQRLRPRRRSAGAFGGDISHRSSVLSGPLRHTRPCYSLQSLPGASTLGLFTFLQFSGISGACPQFADDGKWLIHAATCLQRISAPVSSTHTSRRIVGSRKARQGSWRATPNTERCLVPPTSPLFAQIDNDEEESSKFNSSHDAEVCG